MVSSEVRIVYDDVTSGNERLFYRFAFCMDYGLLGIFPIDSSVHHLT